MPKRILLFFIDNISFKALSVFIKKIAKVLEKVNKIILQWGKKNAIIYNINKTKFVLFSKVHSITVLIIGKRIKFNIETKR